MPHVMASSQVSIDSFPNEIIIQVLSFFPTRSLLPLAAVCRRFYGLVGRVQFSRLVEASMLRDHQVVLECFHPSDRLSTPSLSCEFLGMDGLAEAGDDANLGVLNNLYARFRPFDSDEIFGPRSYLRNKAILGGMAEPAIELPSHEVHLESDMLFSQLCTIVNLVKVEPRDGAFLSIANVTDSVIRIWREWLQRAAANTAGEQRRASLEVDDPSILWTDSAKSVGLRFRVVEDHSTPAPVLLGRDDEPSVSYSMEYQELLIRANQLLLSFETSEAQQVIHSGAIYFPGSGLKYQPCDAFLQCAIPMTRQIQWMTPAFAM
ncbi:hypothetical protein GGR54DRAFT_601745 [Hypoxylon sp. NC1633]|nr:hypothetical protein GGR54DRAFT_601745 [Hypoxylon sp. NC1633]